ncbi:MAG: phosphoenolpyruvate carboxykinase [Tissierellia bacterium]|nr:phosphoenolpyruvate carboxykinase [Tissierellia bacterium]
MIKSWSLSNDKAMINFSSNYCTTEGEILSSDAFKSVLEHFFKRVSNNYSKNRYLIEEFYEKDKAIDSLISTLKLLSVMNSKELSNNFKDLSFVYENKRRFRSLIEDIYTYWRNLERYALIFESAGKNGLEHSSFIDVKSRFDKLVLTLYRKISDNISMTTPKVHRQVRAGSNVGLVLKNIIWPIPEDYRVLSSIPFIVDVVLESPFITYPKRNTRSGFFEETTINPIIRASINSDDFLAYPILVGDLLCYAFCHRDFMTHLISLSNLFEMASVSDIAGKKPDLMVIFGYEDENSPCDIFYDDVENDMIVGYISNDKKYDYFGYMKKMILTLHNIKQMQRNNLPIHGSMINLELNDSKKANIVIMGDSGAGKSESIEALRSLSEENLRDMTIIFDDMGDFRINPAGGKPLAYGTETGAFVRLDDLDQGFAFKQLDRSIFMNPDKTNARLINPVSDYSEIMAGSSVDVFLYANNYDEVSDYDSSIEQFKNASEAKEVFKAGMRQAKGTTSEKGLTKSYFANPFGPYQKQDLCDKLIDKYFDELFDKNVYVGELKTQLGIRGKEKTGPRKAALELFELIRELNEKKYSLK